MIWLPLMWDGQSRWPMCTCWYLQLFHGHLPVHKQTTHMGSTKWVPATVLLWALNAFVMTWGLLPSAPWSHQGMFSSRNLFPTQSWVWLNSTVPFSAAKTIMINSAQHCSQQQQHQRVYSFPYRIAVCNCSSLCVVLSRGSLGLYTSDVHIWVNTLLYKISDMQVML